MFISSCFYLIFLLTFPSLFAQTFLELLPIISQNVSCWHISIQAILENQYSSKDLFAFTIVQFWWGREPSILELNFRALDQWRGEKRRGKSFRACSKEVFCLLAVSSRDFLIYYNYPKDKIQPQSILRSHLLSKHKKIKISRILLKE